MEYAKNKRFYERIFSISEIEYCLSKEHPYQHFAVRYCAKEAFIKAVDRNIKDYKEIMVRMSNGKPSIQWNGRKYLLSLSHSQDVAVAFVVVDDEK